MNTEKEILDGYVISAETQIFIYQKGMNKHKANWTNPEEFNPDHFLNGQDKNLTFQFGGGARICPVSHVFDNLIKLFKIKYFFFFF